MRLTISSICLNAFTHIKSSIRFICCYLVVFLSYMSKSIKAINNNYEAQILAAKTHGGSKSLLQSIFLLCNKCLWGATYFDKNRLPPDRNTCPLCGTNNNELSSFPIMPNESFAFSYDAKRGLEIEFKPR
jgi:hypothetical protein